MDEKVTTTPEWLCGLIGSAKDDPLSGCASISDMHIQWVIEKLCKMAQSDRSGVWEALGGDKRLDYAMLEAFRKWSPLNRKLHEVVIKQGLLVSDMINDIQAQTDATKALMQQMCD